MSRSTLARCVSGPPTIREAGLDPVTYSLRPAHRRTAEVRDSTEPRAQVPVPETPPLIGLVPIARAPHPSILKTGGRLLLRTDRTPLRAARCANDAGSSGEREATMHHRSVHKDSTPAVDQDVTYRLIAASHTRTESARHLSLAFPPSRRRGRDTVCETWLTHALAAAELAPNACGSDSGYSSVPAGSPQTPARPGVRNHRRRPRDPIVGAQVAASPRLPCC